MRRLKNKQKNKQYVHRVATRWTPDKIEKDHNESIRHKADDPEYRVSDFSPEQKLIAAIIITALRDTQSLDKIVRRETMAWFRNGKALRYLIDLANFPNVETNFAIKRVLEYIGREEVFRQEPTEQRQQRYQAQHKNLRHLIDEILGVEI